MKEMNDRDMNVREMILKYGTGYPTDKELLSEIFRKRKPSEYDMSLLREYVSRENSIRKQLTNPSDVTMFVGHTTMGDTETFCVLALNGHKEVLDMLEMTSYKESECMVNPRKIYHFLVEKEASACILAHNHPSGNLTPSDADIKTTETLVKGCRLLGLQVLDHVIISQKGYYSFVEHNMIDNN